MFFFNRINVSSVELTDFAFVLLWDVPQTFIAAIIEIPPDNQF